MNTLQKMSDSDRKRYNTDKGTYHNYLGKYQELFEPLKDKDLNILEIGIWNGGSLRLWKDFFKKSYIYGVDIDPKRMIDTEDRVITFTGDAKQAGCINWWTEMMRRNGQLDIVIDDASHVLWDQLASFFYIKEYLNPGGMYIIEDPHVKKHPYIVQMFKDLGFEAFEGGKVSDDWLLIWRKPE